MVTLKCILSIIFPGRGVKMGVGGVMWKFVSFFFCEGGMEPFLELSKGVETTLAIHNRKIHQT